MGSTHSSAGPAPACRSLRHYGSEEKKDEITIGYYIEIEVEVEAGDRVNINTHTHCNTHCTALYFYHTGTSGVE